MCLTRVQAIEVAEAVEKAGVKLVVNCKFRIAPTVQKAKELIPSPRISHGQLATDHLRAHTAGDKKQRAGCGIKTMVAGCWSARHSIRLICLPI